MSYILCTSCQYPLGYYITIYKSIKQDLMDEFLKKKGIKKNKSMLNTSLIYDCVDNSEIELKQILDDLTITRLCCRTHILTQLEFHDLIK